MKFKKSINFARESITGIYEQADKKKIGRVIATRLVDQAYLNGYIEHVSDFYTTIKELRAHAVNEHDAAAYDLVAGEIQKNFQEVYGYFTTKYNFRKGGNPGLVTLAEDYYKFIEEMQENGK